MRHRRPQSRRLPPGLPFLLPSVAGFLSFYVLPFFIILYYSLLKDPFRREYAGLANYLRLLDNPAFLLGLKNTLLFLCAAAGIALILSLLLALALERLLPRSRLFRSALLLPLTVPTAALLLLVSVLWDYHGAANALLVALGLPAASWLNGGWSRLTYTLLFLWKYVGLSAMLFLAALQTIPREEREAAALDGASGLRRFFSVELPHLTPTALFVLLCLLLFGFRFFREIYLISGRYPAREMYLLQHFMHNVFELLDYQKLSAAAVLLFLLTSLLMGGLVLLSRRLGAGSVLSLPEPEGCRSGWGRVRCGGILLAALLLLLCLLPSLLTLTHSLAGEEELQTRYAAVFDRQNLREVQTPLLLWPERPGTEAYQTLLADNRFPQRAWNSVALAVPALLGQLFVSVWAAYGFCRWQGKGRNALFLLYVILFLMPYEVTLLPNFLMARWLGVYDSRWAVWLPCWFSPLPVCLLAKQMERVPAELREAAALDGAGERRILFHIVLPQLRGTLGVMIFLLFIDVWNMIELPLTLFKTDALQPLSVWLGSVRSLALAPHFASAVLYSLPPLLLFFVSQRRRETK